MTRVLVIDDEAPIRLLCRVNLEAEGMRVSEAGDRERFPFESLDASAIAGQRGRQDLDRDVALEPRIVGAVDGAHAPRAEQIDDLERADTCAG